MENKVKSVPSAHAIKTQKELISFLGFLSFYQRFVPKFAAITKTLHDLVAKLSQQEGVKTKKRVIAELWSP